MELPDNFLLINKPVGWTSFDVVAYVRKIARAKTGDKKIKVGHAGTLDPFATGLLIVGIGREATKRLDEFKNLPKTYVATIHLGAVSDTYDVTGTILVTRNLELATRDDKKVTSFELQVTNIPSQQTILSTLELFAGKQSQIPPMYSAKKIGGQRLYKLARQGKVVERQPSPIEIYSIKLLDYTWPYLKIEVVCSAGTYIRSLAHDFGKRLSVGGYCEALVRTKIGDYLLENAKELGAI